MRPDFYEILMEHNAHSTFLNPKGCCEALKKTYEMGKQDGVEELLKWLSEMEYFHEDTNFIKKRWENYVKDNL